MLNERTKHIKKEIEEMLSRFKTKYVCVGAK